MSTRIRVWVVVSMVGGLLAGCGGSSGSSPSGSSTSPAQTAVKGVAVSAADTSAVVAGAPIAKESYQHWVTIDKKFGAGHLASNQALGYLITSEWVLHEAAARHITVSEAEVRKSFAALLRLRFQKPGSLQEYLSKVHETEADLLARIRVGLLSTKIAAQVTAGKKGVKRTAALRRFQKNYLKHWKSMTNCKPGYVIEYCKQYKGKPEHLAAPPKERVPPVSLKGEPTNGNPAATGETYPAPGGLLISSPAFERNAPIPTEYTCAGAGISPPISFENVPQGTAELLLYVIDGNPKSKPNWGQLWVVGGIAPDVKEIPAGHLPAGAVVGTNDLGKAEYTPICPVQGESTTIEFTVFALRKKLTPTPGFKPIELKLGANPYLGSATTYGVATR